MLLDHRVGLVDHSCTKYVVRSQGRAGRTRTSTQPPMATRFALRFRPGTEAHCGLTGSIYTAGFLPINGDGFVYSNEMVALISIS